MKKYLCSLIAALFTLLAGVEPGWCAIIHVPADYPTVQQGLNAASQHDTVLVADGLYYENLRFPALNLTLASLYLIDGDSAHVAHTILNGSQPVNPDSGSVFYMEGNQDSTTVIAGLSFTGGTGILSHTWWPGDPWRYGGGLVIRHAGPIVKNNHIYSNQANKGGGLYLGTDARAILQYNDISYNVGTGTPNWVEGGGGAIWGDSCSPQISVNQIHDNLGTGGGGLYFINVDSAALINNFIEHNGAYWAGAGAFLGGDYTVIGNVIADNASTSMNSGFSFGALPILTTVTIINNQFLRNTNPDVDGALSLTSGVIGLVSGNLFQENHSSSGASLDLWDGNYSVLNNQFIHNTGTTGGVIYIGLNASVEVRGNVIAGNVGVPPQNSSAIYDYFNAPVDIHENYISGNSPLAVILADISPVHTINALNNWWGDASGPYHPTLNPQGLGDEVGDGVLFDPWLTSFVGVPQEPASHPTEFHLYPPRPNPFNPATAISYTLQAASHVKLKVFDTAGRLVATLVDGYRQAGSQEITFDGSGLASGVYLYTLAAGNYSATGKMVLLK